MTLPAASNSARFGFRVWLRLIVLCSAILFEGMSLSGIQVQLGIIARDLSAGSGQMQWVATAFLVAYASCLIVGGRCADLYGARKIFVFGVIIFGIGALAAGFSSNIQSIIAARALQGLGAALSTPASIALIVSEFPPGPPRSRALSFFSSMGAIGFTLGVVVVGMVTAWWGWRASYFLFAVPSLLVALFARFAARGVSDGKTDKVPWVQVSLSAVGLVAFLHAIERLGVQEITEALCALLLVCATAVIIRLVQQRTGLLLVPEGLLGRIGLILAALSLGGGFAAVTGAMYLVSISLAIHNYTPFQIGLILLPQGLAVAVFSPLASRIINKSSPGKTILLGLVILSLGLVAYQVSAMHFYTDKLLVGTMLVGAGIAFLYPAATLLASVSAGSTEQGTASAILTTCQQIGSAVGVAVVVAIQQLSGSSEVFHGLAACFFIAVFFASAHFTGLYWLRRKL